MLDLKFDYASCINASEKVAWRLDEIFPQSTVISLEKPHLPESLSGTAALTSLKAEEQLALNHIRGNTYMNLFGFVEEYIIAQVVQHAQGELFGDQEAVRALLRFGEEETKHQILFKRYCAAFDRAFGGHCQVLDSASAVAQVILSKSPFAVMLTTLHIELMTQHHYTGSIKDNARLDPLFTSILKHHWLEESQHARLDTLELDKLADECSQAQRDEGYDEYVGIVKALDGLLAQQTDMDIESLRERTGKKLVGAEKDTVRKSQLDSYRTVFIEMGMKHKNFLDIAQKLSPTGHEKMLGYLQNIR